MRTPFGFFAGGTATVPIQATAPPPANSSGGTLLLDTVAAQVYGAYALRRLRSAYTGAAVRVRRASDNAEQDIGFDASGLLDTTALTTWCGSGDGFAATWYDQSYQAQDVTQPIPAQQPQIVAAGVVLALGNAAARPSLLFQSANAQCFERATYSLAGPAFSSLSVVQRTATVSANNRMLSYVGPTASVDYDNGASAIFAFLSSDGVLHAFQSGGDKSAVPLGLDPAQVMSLWDGTSATLVVDGAAGTPGAYSTITGGGALTVGGRHGGQETWDGPHAEHIIVGGALSPADQAAIRSSQQAYYGTP